MIEQALTRVRWLAAALLLLSLPLVPAHGRVAVVLIAIATAAGNVLAARLLSREPCGARLDTVRRLTTGLEWTGVTGVIIAMSPHQGAPTPALLLAVLLTSSLRYRRRGLVVGLVASWFVIALCVGLQVWVHNLLSIQQGLRSLAGWLVAMTVMTLVIGGIIQVTDIVRSWDAVQRNAAGTDESVESNTGLTRLSNREREILDLLQRSELTYNEIADSLHVDQSTIKTHVKRIGDKLGVRGRQAVIQAARERGLLRAEDPATPPRLRLMTPPVDTAVNHG